MAINTLLLLVISLLLSSLLRFLQRVWWDPIQLQKKMARQGIKGPLYKFLQGNTREAAAMEEESMSKPMNLSHDITPRVQPHLHAWVKSYGT